MTKSITPEYITGFVDGEGSFHVAIYNDIHMKYGIKIIPEFHVSQRKSSITILAELKSYFRCGYIKENHPGNQRDSTYVYVVRNRDDLLKKIIPFFKKHTLRTEKMRAFQSFARIVTLMSLGSHASKQGIQRILNIAYSMNAKGKYRKKRIVISEPSETIRRTRRRGEKI